MTISKNNEILAASLSELRHEWKSNEYDQMYSFNEYVDIMVNHNNVKIIPELYPETAKDK